MSSLLLINFFEKEDVSYCLHMGEKKKYETTLSDWEINVVITCNVKITDSQF